MTETDRLDIAKLRNTTLLIQSPDVRRKMQEAITALAAEYERVDGRGKDVEWVTAKAPPGASRFRRTNNA